MIVREKPDSYVLIKQHDHGLAAGEFARHWARGPRPLESALYAIAHHDVAWQGPDARVRWNEETGRPYSFADYPPEPKVRAYDDGLDWLEERDPYAACLCSMHYETLMRRFGGSEVEERFADAESRRQEKLRAGMSEEELQSLGYSLRLLRLCDGLSLFICLSPGVAAAGVMAIEVGLVGVIYPNRVEVGQCDSKRRYHLTFVQALGEVHIGEHRQRLRCLPAPDEFPVVHCVIAAGASVGEALGLLLISAGQR